jgi:hypothetical protein
VPSGASQLDRDQPAGLSTPCLFTTAHSRWPVDLPGTLPIIGRAIIKQRGAGGVVPREGPAAEAGAKQVNGGSLDVLLMGPRGCCNLATYNR